MMPLFVWPWRRPRLGIALSEQWLVAVRDGGPWAATELPPGLVKPSPVTPNVQSVAELALATCQLVEQLGSSGGTAVVALPDLAVTTTLIADASKLKERELRSAIAGRLPYEASETRSDFWRGLRHEALGAAVRRAVIRQYEQIVEATGARLGWIDTCSLSRIPGWAQESTSDDSMAVRIQLFSAHYSLAVFRTGELIDLRFKLRPPRTPETVARELGRLPSIYGATLGSITLAGDGALACAERVREATDLGTIGIEEEDEQSLLVASARIILKRLKR